MKVLWVPKHCGGVYSDICSVNASIERDEVNGPPPALPTPCAADIPVKWGRYAPAPIKTLIKKKIEKKQTLPDYPIWISRHKNPARSGVCLGPVLEKSGRYFAEFVEGNVKPITPPLPCESGGGETIWVKAVVKGREIVTFEEIEVEEEIG